MSLNTPVMSRGSQIWEMAVSKKHYENLSIHIFFSYVNIKKIIGNIMINFNMYVEHTYCLYA